MARAIVLAAAGALVAGCGAETAPERPGADAARQAPTAADPSQRYRTTTMVLESAGHGPMLCLAGVAESYPPQCGNVPIANWDWDAVGRKQCAFGTTWGVYEVVGTFDGASFTVLSARPAGRAREPVAAYARALPCARPPNGWQMPDPDRISERDLQSASRAARSEPDFAGEWIHYLRRPAVERPFAGDSVVAVFAFTGQLARHEAELREHWGGTLCVARHERTERELERIQDDLDSGGAQALGLELLSAAVNVVANVVELDVVLADDEAERALDERYGEGAVRVSSALEPIP